MEPITTNSNKRTNSVFHGIWKSASKKWRLTFAFMGLLIGLNAAILGLSQWYRWYHRGEPVVVGATFIPNYATHFGLDPEQTLNAMLGELGIRHVRLVSYWSDIEATKGSYDFSQLDWQFSVANKYNAKVSLAVGLRQPRWPECHLPEWAANEPKEVWEQQLNDFMSAVVSRYQSNPALESYQLENEYFLKAFGQCSNFDRERLVSEYELVKAADSEHPVIVSRSNNALGWPVNAPTPDQYGVSVYKRVWDKTITHRYFEYPFPAQFYGALAAMSQITQSKPMFIHELQAEAWGPTDILNLSLVEQNKTMDAQKLSERINYGLASGMKRADLWGAEYWYYRQQKLNDPSLWNAAKSSLQARSPKSVD